MTNIILTSKIELEAIIQESVRKAINEGKREMPDDHTEILNIQEASKYLNLAKQTLYSFTSKRVIPFFKKGKKLYFKRIELNNWLTEGKQLSKDEIESFGKISKKR